MCTHLATPDAGAAETAGAIQIHSSLEESGTETDWFTVTGLPSKLADQLRDAALSSAEWKRIFPVAVNQPDLALAIEQPPMAGGYDINESVIKFEPRFPLSPGTRYRATFNPKAIPEEHELDPVSVSRVFEASKLAQAEPTSVVAIYPSVDELPENLLKFYVHFSGPMSGDRVHRFIQLINVETGPVELPFLELDDALWNFDMTQLTLFIDPGRIKREVKPLEDVGPSLMTGQRYRLVIDQNWLDANGNKLTGAYIKQFEVKPPDRLSPKIEEWQLATPKSGGRDSLTVNFGEPMDHALAQRMIHIETAHGKEISGYVSLEENDSIWKFVPDAPWTRGEYQLIVQTTIEDLAGNNIGRLFEVDLRRETGLKPLQKFARRSFQIR